jgi:AraC family transcriptional regulator
VEALITHPQAEYSPSNAGIAAASEHVIEINLSPNSLVECRADGRLHQEGIGYGATMLAPAYGYYQLANLTNMESVSIALEPDFVARTAHEILDAERVELTMAMGTFDPLIYGIGMALKTELESSSPVCGLYIDSLANTLATHLLRRYTSAPDARVVVAEGALQHDFTQVIGNYSGLKYKVDFSNMRPVFARV